MLRSKVLYCFSVLLLTLVSCNSGDKHVKPVFKSDPNSIESIKKAIKANPDSLMLKENLIEAYRNAGYYDSAISVADAEIKKDSGSAYLWNIEASLYFENNDTSNAIRCLKRAIDIYPLPDYLVALGTVYAEIKNNEALKIADHLLASNKKKYGKDAYFIRGLFYNYVKEPNKAIQNLDSCLQLDFTYMYAYREKGIALYAQSKYEEAIKVLKRAVTLQNNFDEGYYWLGRCYEKLNKKNEAIESYQNALLYDKNYIEAREALDKLEGTEKE